MPTTSTPKFSTREHPYNPPCVDIGELLPDDFDRSGMCDSNNYRKFEQRAVTYLASQGWVFPVHHVAYRLEEGCVRFRYRYGSEFITTDGDDFGPLVRELLDAIRPDGTIVDILHG